MALSKNKWTIVVATAVATALAIWNVYDEFYILQSWSNVAFFVAMWLLLPYVNALAGLVSKKPFIVRASQLLSIVYLIVFLPYALNGSTQSREGAGGGAEHVHLILVPFLLALISALVLCYLGIREVVMARLRARKGGTES